MTPEREADQRSPSRMASRWKQFQIFRMAKYARFLLRSIFNTFIRPPLVIFILSKTGLLSLPHHRALCVGVYLASVPFSEIILSLRSSNLKKKDCERLGAVSAPKIRGRKLGNVDVLQALIEAEESEYPGDIFLEWAKEYGPTFDMNILWASQIVTCMYSDPFGSHRLPLPPLPLTTFHILQWTLKTSSMCCRLRSPRLKRARNFMICSRVSGERASSPQTAKPGDSIDPTRDRSSPWSDCPTLARSSTIWTKCSIF